MENEIATSKLPKHTENLRDLIVNSLEDDKAEDVVVVDLDGKTSIADFMIVASGRSQRHVGSLADNLNISLKDNGFDTYGIEGQDSCDWVLLDAGDIIVHLFRPEMREAYNLEKLWSIPSADEHSHLG